MTAPWRVTRGHIDLSRPQVMGIVNTTPDSFSDGGAHDSAGAALAHCERLLRDGADILDIGGESSRPGAVEVPLDEELRRVLPVLRGALSLGKPVSVDTVKAGVMQAALDLGVDIVNDIQALRGAGALDVVAAHPSCGVVLMHMQGAPRSMQVAPVYTDVVEEVSRFLRDQAARAESHGVSAERIVIDAGFGFGKSPAHNLDLLRRHGELGRLGYPLLAGWSRKSTIGHLTGRDTAGRLAGSLAAALASVVRGASVVRVHDVAETVDALKVWDAAGLVPQPPPSKGVA